MPDTPVYGITYPCATSPVSMNDFRVLAEDTETAVNVVDFEGVAATHLANGRAFGTANPAFAVEATLVYTASPAQNTTTGITLNTATGVFTVLTGGIYSASVRNLGAQSTLTVTSHRMSVAVNGVNQVTRKYRGSNPPDQFSMTGAYSCDIFAAVGDLVTFRFLWTGTGALLGPVQAYVALDLLATP
jgi:hypothetical protein